MGSESAPAVYVPSRTGKSLLLHDGYTFYLKNLQANGRKQWYCSSRDMAGCRADVITAPARSGNGDILFLVRGRHIHAPPSYYFTPDGKYVRRKDAYHRYSGGLRLDVGMASTQQQQGGARYLYTARGGKLLFYEGNTYFVNSRKKREKARVLWYCSSRKSRNCPASILTLYDRVLGQPPEHTHPPKVSSGFSTATINEYFAD
ncbi:hypothetical protein KGM_208240 [Danaus plexippus plexippus]|uniref:FLYWCH-type domain-containing protein n=1 Tax=Danaus plexippus plexippus TaxID=278856 RepID=A0A212F318_DANPL|nr:hypothetical protein KGM_208240 [Danaus plexippus plexippus]